jgi:predicted dehydrogenase
LQQDKGHRGEWEAFAAAIRGGGESPVPFDQIVMSTLATLKAVESRASGQALAVDASHLTGSRPRGDR